MLSSWRRTRAPQAVLMFLGAALTLTAWLYASPPGSSPDDGYHLGSIWCARGFLPDRCLEAPSQGDPDIAFAPAVLGQLTCVAGDGRKPASCQVGLYERLDGQYSLTPANLRGVRATLYYSTAHLFVSDDVAASIARIRVANAALLLLLVTATAAVAPVAVRRAVLATWLVASIPLGLFLITSLNSTAWGLAGLGTFWANAATVLQSEKTWRRWSAAGLALVGIVMALGSRTEASAHLAVIGFALGIWWLFELREPRRSPDVSRRSRLPRLLGGALFAGVAAFTWRSSAIGYAFGTTSGLSAGWERLSARGISNPLLTLAAETPQLWTGALGMGGGSLGWLDTNMPSVVSVGATGSFIALVTLGLTGASRGRIAAVTVLLTGLVVLPVVSLLSVGLVVLEQLQPRHYIPLLYGVLGLALVRSRGQQPLVLGRGARLSIASALTLAHATAVAVNVNRYTRGLTEFLYIDSSREIAWWWGGAAPSPGAVIAMGGIGFAILAFNVLDLFRRGGDEAEAVPVERQPARA